MQTKLKMLCASLVFVLAVLFSVGCQDNRAEAVSLYSGPGLRNMFADKRASQVGDIITIVISENTSTSNTKSSNNSKSGEQSIAAGAGIFRGIMGGSASQNDSFSANGSSTNSNRVSGRITVTVVDVLDNGNLVVEGTQSIWQNKNEERITIHGIIRPEDVTVNNTVPSNKISDATIKFDGKGPMYAKQRQGILTQIFNFLF